MANPKLEIIDPNFPDKAYDGSLTFTGVLRCYFNQYEADGSSVGISREWNKETQSTYIKDYNLRLFPLMDRNKPINEYTAEDFNVIIERLQAQKHYAEITIKHYRRLIWLVCEAGYKNGHCDDILWGTCYSLSSEKTDEKSKVQSMVVLKKSFTIHEELQIFHRLMKDPMSISGEELGLLIMFFTGVRNNEACGINYGDIKPMIEHPDSKCLWLYQTTQLDSNQLKASGKTRNADRILPILNNLSEFITMRMNYIEDLISEGTLRLEGEYEDKTLLDLPVVCRGSQYTNRCSARDLTSTGRELLKEITFSSKEMATLDEILHSNDFYNEGIKEKDPTTYLFRRNAGTHFYTLGFSMAEIQYYIGQAVEDLYEDRNSFANEEKLYALKILLDKHPFNFILDTEKPKEPKNIDTTPYLPNVSDTTYHITAEDDNARYLFSMVAREPREPITVSLNSDNPVDVQLNIKAEPVQKDRTVNIHHLLRNAYTDKKINK